MIRPKVRFPLFAKFLSGCLLLAALLIIGGTYDVKDETRLRNRGNFLAKGLRRLDGYVERTGQNLTGTIELLAGDDEIRDGMSPNPPPGSESAADHAKQQYEALMSSDGLKPDLFAIFTTTNRLVWAPPKDPMASANLAQIAAVEKARGGSVFAHRIQVLGGVPYQVSAAPIHASNSDQVVGGMLIGVRFERALSEFADSSDDDK